LYVYSLYCKTNLQAKPIVCDVKYLDSITGFNISILTLCAAFLQENIPGSVGGRKKEGKECTLSHTVKRSQNALGPILGNASPAESKLMRNILTRWCYCVDL